MSNRILLTFDVEDFINVGSLTALRSILELLEKYGLRGVFFITGHMAEKLALLPEITRSLGTHEIGFHSSSHSVHPTIFEYCDVERYEDAYCASLQRETSHIDPLSGDTEGDGGILELRKLFPNKNIEAYRAPGYCCPPPNLDAMVTLGIKFDFSSNFSRIPALYKEITFYPCPLFLDCEKALLSDEANLVSWLIFLRSIFMQGVTVLNFHPDRFVNINSWDCIYHKGNPKKLEGVETRKTQQTHNMLGRMDQLLKAMNYLEKVKIVRTSPDLVVPRATLSVANIDIEKAVDSLTYWPRLFFGYNPKYTYSQLVEFFQLNWEAGT